MKHIYFKIALFLSLSCFAQNHVSEAYKLERQAKSQVLKNPEGALTLVKQALRKPNLTDTIYGSLYNIYGIYFGMKGNNDSLIYYQKKSISYLENYPEKRAQSLIPLGVGYRNKGEHEMALNYLNQSLEIFRGQKNNRGMGTVYGEIGSVYNTLGDYEKSVKYLVQAVELLKKDKATDKLPAVQQKLANTYLAQKNFSFAIDLYNACLPEFKRLGQMKNYYLTLGNLAEAYIHTDNFNKAIEVLNESIRGSEFFGDKTILGVNYAKLGNAEQYLKHYDKAFAAYDKATELMIASGSNRVIRISGEYIGLLSKHKQYTKAIEVIKRVDKLNMYSKSNPEDQSIYKKAVGDAYSGTQQADAAIAAYQQSIKIKDSLAEADRSKAIREMQAKFQTELQLEKNHSLEANNKLLQKDLEAEQTRRWLYLTGGIALLVLVLMALRNYRITSKLQRTKLQSLEAEKNMIAQQHLHEQELTNAQRNIIDEKQRELTSTALRMANLQDSLNQMIDKCNNGEISRVSDLKKELQLLSRQEDYWKQFETRFNHVHPEFSNSLQNRFNKLTKNDIEFCSLLKLNLSNKEIASLLQISHESVITKKYRIKKKMEINDDETFERLIKEM
ncbi:tetratricopeptide repeat protein [Flavobacterium sp. RNTU_13]|uniref:tetratricopeptide repeat protein n=1 Tax=Flavobacterium sp. RNTU_13 TaxID=3375145 RepID=UPI003986157A